MTRIGVFSDSHGDRDALERLRRNGGTLTPLVFWATFHPTRCFFEKLEEMPHQPVLYAVGAITI